MSKTSTFNTIIQKLDSLSRTELLEIREKVDALIQRNSIFLSSKSGVTHIFGSQHRFLSGSYKASTGIKVLPVSVDSDIYVHNIPNIGKEPIVNEKDNSLDKVIGLMDEWMADESGYDEQAYPEIEAGLKQNKFSI